MENVLEFLPRLSKQISAAKGCLLLLDFDGTLASITKKPARAFLPKMNRNILKKISRHIPTAVISGRSLADIKRKINITGLIYAGNHGLEWKIKNHKQASVHIPPSMASALVLANKRLNNLCKKFHGALLENKKITLSLHYRLVKKKMIKELLQNARQIINPFIKQRLINIISGKKVLEVRPALRWNKGLWVKFIRQELGCQLLPIYIGDDITDEDAFKILKSGITIRVGKNINSKAKYYCNNNKQVGKFISWLLGEMQKIKQGTC